MSGTFYSSAAPGEPAFCKVGDRVKKGQTVGIIEAMKLMNEIEVREAPSWLLLSSGYLRPNDDCPRSRASMLQFLAVDP